MLNLNPFLGFFPGARGGGGGGGALRLLPPTLWCPFFQVVSDGYTVDAESVEHRTRKTGIAGAVLGVTLAANWGLQRFQCPIAPFYVQGKGRLGSGHTPWKTPKSDIHGTGAVKVPSEVLPMPPASPGLGPHPPGGMRAHPVCSSPGSARLVGAPSVGMLGGRCLSGNPTTRYLTP